VTIAPAPVPCVSKSDDEDLLSWIAFCNSVGAVKKRQAHY